MVYIAITGECIYLLYFRFRCGLARAKEKDEEASRFHREHERFSAHGAAGATSRRVQSMHSTLLLTIHSRNKNRPVARVNCLL